VSRQADAYDRFNLVGDLDYPMFIVTTRSTKGERAGCLVGFATQCSIDPPRVLVCISRANRTYRVAEDAEALGVHFVPAAAVELAVARVRFADLGTRFGTPFLTCRD